MNEWTQRQQKLDKEVEQKLTCADQAEPSGQESKIRELEEKVKQLEQQLEK